MLKDKLGREVGIGDWIQNVNGTRVIVDTNIGNGLLVKVWDVIFDDYGMYDYDSKHDGYITPYEVRQYERV